MKKFKDNNKGFSLVELIVVIAIMVVLIAVLGSTILGYVEKSKHSKDMSALDATNTAIKTFIAEPTSEYSAGIYTLEYLVKNCDKAGVIMPILAEVFVSNSTTSNGTTTTTYKFQGSSKAFDGITTADVYVKIEDNGSTSIFVESKKPGYSDYKSGNGLTSKPTSGVNSPATNNNNNNNNNTNNNQQQGGE